MCSTIGEALPNNNPEATVSQSQAWTIFSATVRHAIYFLTHDLLLA